MTIIASIQRHDGIMTLSDIMISSPSHIVSKPMVLPLTGLMNSFFGPGSPAAAMPQDFAPSSSAQKCIRFGNCLALWAGSAHIARVILKELALAQERGEGHEAISDLVVRIGLSQQQIESVSIIVFYDTGNDIQQDTLNVERLAALSADIVYAGTGSFPVIDDPHEDGLADDHESFQTLALNRVAAAVLGEIVQENRLFHFGLWFELAECPAGRFSKIPYLLKFWNVDNDRVADGPGFLSGYNGHDLLLFSLDKRQKTAARPFVVPDFLGRKETTAQMWFIPEEEHALEFHVINVSDIRRTYFLVLGKGEHALKVNVSETGLNWSCNPDFLKRIYQDIRAGNQVSQKLKKYSSEWKE